MVLRERTRFGRSPADAPALLVALCALLAGCVSAPAPARMAAFPPISVPTAAPPLPATQPASPAAIAVAESTPLEAGEKACADLASGTDTRPPRALAKAPPPAPPEEQGSADVPDPAAATDQAKAKATVLAAVEPTAGSSVKPDLAKRIAARSAELTTANAAATEAEKTAASGHTARAAELYAEDWKAQPTNWPAAFKAIELWARIGDYLRAEILVKAVEAKADATHDAEVGQEARALDDKLTVLAGATNEAQRLWRRTFVLEHENRYTEAVTLLRRLQDFEPTAPGYYIREASLFARCEDVPHAAAAIARGSAAGVSYAGRWAPARDPALIRLWSNPDFVAAIRDTLGEAGVEDFEERLSAR